MFTLLAHQRYQVMVAGGERLSGMVAYKDDDVLVLDCGEQTWVLKQSAVLGYSRLPGARL